MRFLVITFLSLCLSHSASAKDIRFLADLQCKGESEKGETVKFHVDGIYDKLTIGHKKYDLEKMTTKGDVTILTAEKGNDRVKVAVSKHYKKARLLLENGDQIVARCSDSLPGKGDDDDLGDYEEHDPSEFITVGQD